MSKRQTVLRLVVLGVVLSALGAGLWAWTQSKTYPATDAVEITAPVVSISAMVPGRVISVPVENNHAVAEGDLLFAVDPEPYELELQQAQATLASAESELRQGEGNRALERSNALVAAQQIARARNNLSLAKQTFERLEPLLEQGYVTAQEVDTARTSVKDAEVTLEQAESHATGTDAFVGTLDTRRAQVDAARAAVALAERNLRNTKIYAPRAGVLTGLTLTAGEYVLTGTPLFSLIDNAHWHASALFRETDLPAIAVGDRARVFLLAAPDHPIEGRVSAIGWGIHSAEEAQILGMPLVANNLDWVRSARRYPVEIELEEAPEGLVRLGATASVRILGAGE